ncbi:Helicase swr1 [Morus notabilis]|uniref:Helicase swr1 n=1 Tax=Morus notabilis TaxID=981085 RepID=W9QTR3_9ROSA|nr:Helicase swr1 [Morus notabilis]
MWDSTMILTYHHASDTDVHGGPLWPFQVAPFATWARGGACTDTNCYNPWVGTHSQKLACRAQVALAELLPSLKQAGHRVLIFSQWTSMLDILEWALDVIGITYRRLDGSFDWDDLCGYFMAKKPMQVGCIELKGPVAPLFELTRGVSHVTDRQTIVDTFNNDTSIFACLLSTRAGGQGLNLTGADTVVIHDLDFNPQIDRQAEDRCHRIGQTKPVTIYRLVTKGTVDENVYETAKRKLVLDAAVLENGMETNNEGDAPEKTMGEILSALLLG